MAHKKIIYPHLNINIFENEPDHFEATPDKDNSPSIKVGLSQR